MRTAQVQPVTDPVITLCQTILTPTTGHTESTRDTVDEGTGLRAALELEEVNEVLRGYRSKAAVGVSRGAGVS